MKRITGKQIKQILQRYPIKGIDFKYTPESYTAEIVEVSFLQTEYKVQIVYDISSDLTSVNSYYRADEELIPVTLEDVVNKLCDADKEDLKQYILENYL